MIFHVITIILIIFGCAGAHELIPWETDSCKNVTVSCRPDQDKNTRRECEDICKGQNCTIRVAIVLPDDDFYIVDANSSLHELQLAENYSKQIGILPENMLVEYKVYNDRCEQAYATLGIIDAYTEYCAHVIFGPICDYCLASAGRSAKFLGSYGTPLITPGGFSFDFVVKKVECVDEFFMIINSGMVDYLSFAEFLYLIMLKYNWRKYALMYEKYDQNEVAGSQGCQLLMKTVMEQIKVIDNLQFDDGDIQLLKISYEDYLKGKVGVKYGIIALCTSHEHTREILLQAEKLKMTEGGEYIFLNFDLYNNASHASKPWYNHNDTSENNERARQAYRSLFTFTPLTEADYAEKEENPPEPRGNLYLDGIYDGFLLYSHALNETLQTFYNTNSKPNISIRGVDIVSKMYGYKYIGRHNRSVTINCNGQRVAEYAMMQMNSEDKFHIVAKYNTLDKKMTMLREVTWVSGSNPGDTPLCGYDNSKCPSEVNIYLIVACVVFAIIFIILSTLVYRHFKLEEEISSMTWKVNYSDINLIDKPHSIYSSTGSIAKRGSQTTLVSEMEGFSLAGDRQIYTTVGYYKAIRVAVKRLKDTKIELNREQLREMKVMKDLSNDHLVKFYGACLESPHCCILTEYCPKGSLQDVLENAEVKLDWVFRLSLIHDIVRGMQYLHNSDIKSHGALKSSNCVVDSRFVLKITDFGMSFLRCYSVDDHIDLGSTAGDEIHSYWQKQLWTAPELLRMENPPIKGTQKGDVYSFSIIVHEIVTRQGVFYLGNNNDISKKEIVDAIKKGPEPGSSQPLRPLIDACDEEVSNLMQRCWAEEAADRPDFNALKNTIRKINRGNGNDGNLLDNLLSRMEQYANNLETLVEERTADYLEEKRKCEELLYQLLPKSVALQLITGQSVIAETFDQVTIYFSDIVGFTSLSAQSTPLEVVYLLNDLYTCFDSIIEEFDVYKVETIGDAYMVVSGLPERNEDKHACEIARMSLALLAAVRKFKIKHRPEEPLKLRIGMHTGPCVAGVVGLKMPRYCLFGDTVNTASRMESNGEPLKIHVSSATKKVLENFKSFDLECRGDIDIKGKGKMTTYWLKGETKRAITENKTDKPVKTKQITGIPMPRREITFSNNGSSLNTAGISAARDEASIPLLSIIIPDDHSQI